MRKLNYYSFESKKLSRVEIKIIKYAYITTFIYFNYHNVYFVHMILVYMIYNINIYI